MDITRTLMVGPGRAKPVHSVKCKVAHVEMRTQDAGTDNGNKVAGLCVPEPPERYADTDHDGTAGGKHLPVPSGRRHYPDRRKNRRLGYMAIAARIEPGCEHKDK